MSSPEQGSVLYPKASPSFGRLMEAIEKKEGRDKYRAKTKSPSDGDTVRWYFSKAPISLQEVAALIPTTEVVGKSDFLRFSVNDSLALEAAFLEQEEMLVSAWWKEYAECSEGPATKGEVPLVKLGADGSSNAGNAAAYKADESLQLEKLGGIYENDENIGVPVKGGLHEVDLLGRRCYPVYWACDHRRVLRGHWFAQKGGLDWLPLREDVAEQLEFAYRSQVWHRRTFQPSGKFAARLNLQGSTEGLHALFTGEDDTWEAWLNVDASMISFVRGGWGNGIKLRRGFVASRSSQLTQDELQQRKEEENDDFSSQVPIRHLLFMVHGIGQRLDNANLIDDVGTFRSLSMTLAEQHLTAYQRESQRVLFIPCQWRRGLKLSGEEAVESCTLEGVRALRTMLSATVHDVLYYMSPVYCQDIIDSVTGQLNRLYCKFIKRNPGYDGKVSVYAHSLGSVLSYDILCHQHNLISSFPIDRMSDNREEADDFGRQEYSDDSKHHPLEEKFLNVPANQETDLDSLAKEPDITALREEIARLKEKIRSLEEAHDGITSNEGILKIDPLGDVKKATTEERETSLLAQSHKDQPPKEQSPHVPADMLVHIPQTCKSKVKSRCSSRKRYTPFIEYTKLTFEVDTFFAVGSPLGVFLSLRNIRFGNGNGKEYWEDESIEEEMPACKRLFNIFHPFDPVAYRLEPLVSMEYLDKQPIFVPYHKGGKRIHIGVQEFGKGLSARSKAFVNSLTTIGDQVAKKILLVKAAEIDDKESATDSKERTYESLIMERLTGHPCGRIDYMLQDATFEHQYLQAISSHTAYWRDPDTVLFILKQLYCDIPKEDPESVEISTLENTEISTSDEPAQLLGDNSLENDEVAFTFSNQERVIVSRTHSTL